MFSSMILKNSLLINLRFYSIKSKEKSVGAVLKQLNYENKRLFGPTIKNKKLKKSIAVAAKNNDNPPNKVLNSESESFDKKTSTTKQSHSPQHTNLISSEFYWLVEKNSKNKSIKKIEKIERKITNYKKNKVAIANLTHSASSELDNNEDSIPCLSAEENNSAVVEISNYCETIPFRNLKDILKYPLHSSDTTCLEVNIEENPNFNRSLPSVGKILQATMPEANREALMNWKLRKIMQLGIEGFEALQKDHLHKGKILHQAIENYLVNNAIPTSDEVATLWKSIKPAIDVMNPTKVEVTEGKVRHPSLKYHGVVDCVLTMGTDINVVEWKKSDRIKKSIEATYDAPLQLSAYMGALNADPKYSNLIARNGFVVVAYSTGQPAVVYKLDENELNKYWQQWLLRVQEFWIRTRDGTLPEPF